MDNRLIFNNNYSIYDKIRPQYPDELYNDIFEYMGDNDLKTALEIGIGSGQATKPFIDNNFDVTAIDIGENFVSFLNDKFSAYRNFRAVCGDFMEENLLENQYDLIYSATAFHWLPDEKYQKSLCLLKPGGVIALFWNRPFVRNQQDITNIKNAEVYNKYRGTEDKVKPFDESDMVKICSELTDSGLKNVISKIYRRIRSLSTDEYIDLLNTYSDHCSLPIDIKLQFENDMIKALSECGNKINIYDTIDLYLGTKC